MRGFLQLLAAQGLDVEGFGQIGSYLPVVGPVLGRFSDLHCPVAETLTSLRLHSA